MTLSIDNTDHTAKGEDNRIQALTAAIQAIEGGGSGITWSSVPASASAAGTAGQIAYDSNYFYMCVSTNTWKRAAIATW